MRIETPPPSEAHNLEFPWNRANTLKSERENHMAKNERLKMETTSAQGRSMGEASCAESLSAKAQEINVLDIFASREGTRRNTKDPPRLKLRPPKISGNPGDSPDSVMMIQKKEALSTP